MHTHYYIYSYGILRFSSENTASITPSENTTFVRVNDVTMQKASLLKRSLNVSFISNLLSIYFCASEHKFESLNTDSMPFQYLMDQSKEFDGVFRRLNLYLT